MFRFLKTTVLGGILFLVPVVIFIAVIGKALKITSKLAVPIAGQLGFDTVAGIAVAQVIAIVILVLICFIAGLAAKTTLANRFVQSLEANVLEKIPVYDFIKTKTTSALNSEDAEKMNSVLVRFDDSWQLALEVERFEESHVVIYLPGAPDPWSGSVCVVTADRITPLDLTIASAAKLMKRMGKGYEKVIPRSAAYG